jgi:hypothetical protein
MSPNELRSPFTPFPLQVSDGSSHEIRHAKFCMVLRTRFVPANASIGIPESAEWVEAIDNGEVIPIVQPVSSAGKPTLPEMGRQDKAGLRFPS